MAGQHRQRQRRPPPPPRLRDRDDDDRRRRSASPPSATAPGPRSAPSSSAIGAGLTIDEFALWVYLDDVYWAEEGRSSIDATVIAAAAMLLVAARLHPVHDRRRLDRRRSLGSVLGAAARLPPGRDLLRSSAGSCTARSASSSSRSRSTAPAGSASRTRPGRAAATASGDPKKQAKAEERFPPDRRTERFKNAFRDIVGGKPSEGLAAAREEALRRDPRGERRSARASRTHHPPRRRQGRLS